MLNFQGVTHLILTWSPSGGPVDCGGSSDSFRQLVAFGAQELSWKIVGGKGEEWKVEKKNTMETQKSQKKKQW